MSDQDVDGYHIRSLLVNLFAVIFPQLLLQGPDTNSFIKIFATPIAKAFPQGKPDLWFLDTAALQHYLAKGHSHTFRSPVRYYKGLGTSTSKEGAEYFARADVLVRPVHLSQAKMNDGRSGGASYLPPFLRTGTAKVPRELANLPLGLASFMFAFGKEWVHLRRLWVADQSATVTARTVVKHSPQRSLASNITIKELLPEELFADAGLMPTEPITALPTTPASDSTPPAPDHPSVRTSPDPMTEKELVFRDMRRFAFYDLSRHLPCAIDGLTPASRKVVYALLQQATSSGGAPTSLRVSQLVGMVAKNMYYHHGEASMVGVCIHLAQTFVGAAFGNTPLLTSEGQFGTRLHNGSDHAASRYIYSTLSPLALQLFPPSHMLHLPQLREDGEVTEPASLVPLIPLSLTRRSDCISVGFRLFIEARNPREILRRVAKRLNESLPKHSRVGTNLTDQVGCKPSSELLPWYAGFRGSVYSVGQSSLVSKAASGPHAVYWANGRVEFVGMSQQYTVLRIVDLPPQVTIEQLRASVTEAMQAKENVLLRDFSDCSTGEAPDVFIALNTDAFFNRLAKSFSGTSTVGIDLLKNAAEICSQKSKSTPSEPCERGLAVLGAFSDSIPVKCDAKITERWAFVTPHRTLQDLSVSSETPGVVDRVDAVIDAHRTLRLALYRERRECAISQLRAAVNRAKGLKLFTELLAARKVTVADLTGDPVALGTRLRKLGVPQMGGDESSTADDGTGKQRGYQYILRLPLSALSELTVSSTSEKYRNQLVKLREAEAATPESMWLADLQKLDLTLATHEASAVNRVEAALSTSYAIALESSWMKTWIGNAGIAAAVRRSRKHGVALNTVDGCAHFLREAQRFLQNAANRRKGKDDDREEGGEEEAKKADEDGRPADQATGGSTHKPHAAGISAASGSAVNRAVSAVSVSSVAASLLVPAGATDRVTDMLVAATCHDVMQTWWYVCRRAVSDAAIVSKLTAPRGVGFVGGHANRFIEAVATHGLRQFVRIGSR